MARCPACLSMGIALQHEAKGTGCGHCCCFSSSVLVKTRGLSELFVKRWETPQSPSEQGSPKARSPTLLGLLQGMKCGSAPLHKPHSSPPPPPPLQPRGSSDPAPVSASWNFPAEKKKKLQQKIPTRLTWCLLSRPTVTLHHSLGGCGLFSQGDAHPDHFHPPPQHQELQDASRVTDPWLLTLHSSTRETHCHSSPKILQDQVQDQSPEVLWSPGCFNATATGAEQCR